jgi:copper chaperone NosL
VIDQVARLLGLAAAAGLVACSSGPPGPAALDTRNDSCQSCRMTVSNPRFAAQLVAPGEEPRFFDDIGCLATYLRQNPSAGRGAVAFVADHRTRAWILATTAVYARVPRLETPMNSHLVAHADPASRNADSEAAGGVVVAAGEIFGAAGPPGREEPPRP